MIHLLYVPIFIKKLLKFSSFGENFLYCKMYFTKKWRRTIEMMKYLTVDFLFLTKRKSTNKTLPDFCWIIVEILVLPVQSKSFLLRPRTHSHMYIYRQLSTVQCVFALYTQWVASLNSKFLVRKTLRNWIWIARIKY